ncbi:MAG: hypothetical protein N2560_05290 [Ignavibacteria bacterium]|nr:hypothetical protein [Ignavibacteria bacterium]
MNVKKVDTGKLENIKSIQTEPSRQRETSKTSGTSRTNVVNDRLQISDEGKRLFEIRNRIKDKFYDNQEVQLETARRVYDKLFNIPSDNK